MTGPSGNGRRDSTWAIARGRRERMSAKFTGRWDGISALSFNFMHLCGGWKNRSGGHCEGTGTAHPGLARGAPPSKENWPINSEPKLRPLRPSLHTKQAG